MNTPPPPQKKETERKTKRKQQEQVRQPGRIRHLQRWRSSKGKSSIRTPHVINKNITKKTEKQVHENPCFPLFFGNPKKRAEIGRIIFRGQTKPRTEKKENGPKIENVKNGKHYFSPDFLMSPKGRVNKRAGGGGFDIARSTDLFLDPLFWKSIFKGRVHANDIVLQKKWFQHLLGSQETSENLAISRVNKRAGQGLTSGPVNSGLFSTMFYWTGC